MDTKRDVKRVKHAGKPLDGITKRKVGEFLVIEVDVRKASFKGRSYTNLNVFERQQYDDLLYLSNVQLGNPMIRYV